MIKKENLLYLYTTNQSFKVIKGKIRLNSVVCKSNMFKNIFTNLNPISHGKASKKSKLIQQIRLIN